MIIGKKNWILSKKIDLSEQFGTVEEAWIILREPNTDQVMALRELATLNERVMLAGVKDIMASLIVDHNFYADEATKLEPNAALDFVYDKPMAAVELVGKYLEWAFEPFRRAGQAADKQSM